MGVENVKNKPLTEREPKRTVRWKTATAKRKRFMTEAFMVRLEFSLVRSEGTNYEGSCVVRQQAWTEELRICFFCDFFASNTFV